MEVHLRHEIVLDRSKDAVDRGGSVHFDVMPVMCEDMSRTVATKYDCGASATKLRSCAVAIAMITSSAGAFMSLGGIGARKEGVARLPSRAPEVGQVRQPSANGRSDEGRQVSLALSGEREKRAKRDGSQM